MENKIQNLRIPLTSFPLFRPAFFALLAFGFIYPVALYFHLFYTIPWFDMVMHFSGGFLISIGVLAFVTRNVKKGGEFSYGDLLFWGVASALFIGLLWECFELYFGITYWYSADYWGDNGMDVTMDTFGGLIAVWYSFLYFKK